MTEDEILVLESAVEDLYPLWDANWTLKEIPRAATAIRNLFKMGFIDLFFTTKWATGETSLLTDAQSQELMENFDNESYWQPNDDVTVGYYSFAATEKGKEFFRTDENIQKYYRSKYKTVDE